MTERELYDKIEAYLHGELPEDELVRFEAQVAKDPKLAEEVAMHRFEHEAMEVLVERDTKEKMAAWEQEQDSGGSGKLRLLPWILAALAGITLTLLLFVFLPSKPTPPLPPTAPTPSSELPPKTTSEPSTPKAGPDKGETRETPIPNRPALRPEPAEEDKNTPPGPVAMAQKIYDQPALLLGVSRRSSFNHSQVQNDFNAGNMQAVIEALKEAPTNDLRVQQMLGHAYFRTEQFALSEEAFRHILDSSDPALSEEVEAYYLLALLAQGKGNTPEFRQRLRQILEDPNHPGYELASKI